MDWETRRKEIPILKHIVAGSCAGIMEHVGMFPIDTIKVSVTNQKFANFFIVHE